MTIIVVCIVDAIAPEVGWLGTGKPFDVRVVTGERTDDGVIFSAIVVASRLSSVLLSLFDKGFWSLLGVMVECETTLGVGVWGVEV